MSTSFFVSSHLTGIESPTAEAIFFSPQSDSQRHMIRRVAKAVGISSRDQASLGALLKRLEAVSKGAILQPMIVPGCGVAGG
jgi:hypothetical protein